jgi:phage terminase small subunit
MMGRPANQTELAALQGSEYLSPPENSTPEFRKEWRQIVEDFPPTWFRSSDRPVLTEYVRTKMLLDRLHKQVDALGDNLTYLDRNMMPRRHPLLDAVTKAQQNFKMLAVTVRLSPNARRAEVPKSPRQAKKINDNPLGPLAGVI